MNAIPAHPSQDRALELLEAACEVLAEQIASCKGSLRVADERQRAAAARIHGAENAWRYFLLPQYRRLERALAAFSIGLD